MERRERGEKEERKREREREERRERRKMQGMKQLWKKVSGDLGKIHGIVQLVHNWKVGALFTVGLSVLSWFATAGSCAFIAKAQWQRAAGAAAIQAAPQPQFKRRRRHQRRQQIFFNLCYSYFYFRLLISLDLLIRLKGLLLFALLIGNMQNFLQSLGRRYLVGVSAAVVAHSLLQLVIIVSRLLRKSPLIPSRNHAWLTYAGDQVLAYAMMSARSAASGVSNLNRTGIRHMALPDFCKPLHIFCDHVAISIACTFLSSLLLAISAIQNVIWLSNN